MIAENGKTVFKLNFSFALLVTLMLLLSDESIVIACFISSLLHEMGHLLFLYIFGEAPSEIAFGVFGIRIERRTSKFLSYKKEAIIALGGILVNIVIAIFSFFYYYICNSELALKTALVNLLIVSVNAIPVSVLDMGRVFECLFSSFFSKEKTERIMNIISLVTVIFSLVFTAIYTITIGVNLSLIAVTVYLFIVTIIKKWS